MEILNSQNDTLIGDTGFLAGRQRQVFDLLSLFQTSQLIGFIGENGSGKTTLIKNGLFPELEKGFLGIAGKKWKTVTIRPGITPLENLSAGVAQLGLTSGKQKLEEEVFLTESMRLSNEGLKNACQPNPSQKSEFNSLVVIDNFEDLFQYRDVAANASDWDDTVKSFIQNITKCASYTSIPVYFLVVLRTQYMSKLFEYRHFYEKVSSSQFNLPQFRKSEFLEVVKTLLSSSKKKIHKDGMDFLHNQFGKDQKNLTLLGLYLREVLASMADSSKDEIGLETLLQIPSDTLYARKLEDFFDSCDERQKIIVEKLFKQVTVTQDTSSFNKPTLVDHFLKVSGAQLNELGPVIQSVQHTCSYVFEVVMPLQERLELKNQPLTSGLAVIDIKNDQFIPNWPRLVDWIKEERESQDLYKKLSEKASLFDKGLTDYLKTPDLDIALSWYEEQHPDVLWGNQFDSNYEHTISYLLTSKEKYQEEILKKELAQKEKIKRLNRQLIIGGSIAAVIVLIFLGAALKINEERKIAKDSAEDALQSMKAREAAQMSMELAVKAAQREQANAVIAKNLAVRESERADRERKVALGAIEVARSETSRAKDLNKALDVEKEKLNDNVKQLVTKTNEAIAATTRAENAQAYQEAVNTLLALRDKVDKKDFKADAELEELLIDAKGAFEKYTKASSNLQGINLPNNDLYQILLKARTRLAEDDGAFFEIPPNLERLRSGIRKIAISSRGNLAVGGDDGVLLYSKEPYIPGKGPLSRFYLLRDRIRSIEFVNDKELIIGTVLGKLYLFNTATGLNKLLEIGLRYNQIVQQVVTSSKGVFVLAGGQLFKVPQSELTKTTGTKELPKTAAIPKELPKAPGIPKELPKTAAAPNDQTNPAALPGLSVKSIFKFNEDKLLLLSHDNTLVLLDMATLQWQPISNDLNKATITAAVSSGDNLFLGMERGDVIICKKLKLGNVISIQTELIIPAHKTRITSLAYDVSSNKLFSASLDQTANIFDLSIKNVKNDFSTYSLKIEGFDKWIWDFGLIQTGKVKRLLTVDENGELKSWPTGSETLYNDIFSRLNK